MKKLVLSFLLLTSASVAFAKGSNVSEVASPTNSASITLVNNSPKNENLVDECCATASVTVMDEDGNTATAVHTFCAVSGCDVAVAIAVAAAFYEAVDALP